MKIGDYVLVKNDKTGCIYRIKDIIEENKRIYLLFGVEFRISRKEEENNLLPLSNDELQTVKSKIDKNEENIKTKLLNNNVRNRKEKYLLGTIMHIDGDEEYLKKCLELYNEMGIYSYGKCIKEANICNQIGKYLLETNPDVVVVTGHDIYNNNGIKDINNYLNTKHFIKAVREIRKTKGNDCVVIAGACQSNFEALIANGADFASSPGRINIHTFDPAIIAINVVTTPISSFVSKGDITKYIENANEAFGGLQTYGKMRLLF